MQSCKRQVPSFRDPECHLDRLEVTHFTDEHDVWVLAESRAKSSAERMSVSSNFTLVHHAVLMVMKKLDRVFDGQDVVVPVNVDLIDHLSERSRLTRSRWAGNEHQSTRFFAKICDDLR